MATDVAVDPPSETADEEKPTKPTDGDKKKPEPPPKVEPTNWMLTYGLLGGGVLLGLGLVVLMIVRAKNPSAGAEVESRGKHGVRFRQYHAAPAEGCRFLPRTAARQAATGRDENRRQIADGIHRPPKRPTKTQTPAGALSRRRDRCPSRPG